VVSSRHFTDLGESLYSNGWAVEVFTSNRYCRKNKKIESSFEIYNGVHIRRFKQSPFTQTKNIDRLINSFFLNIKWFFALLFKRVDVIILGTDPQFSFFFIPILKLLRPKFRFAIWGFDLYPEAIISAGIKLPRLIIRLLKWWAGVSYRQCGLLVDIGSCMRKRFLEYKPKARLETIVPWALNEPEKHDEQNCEIRYELFGNTDLGILYSGTIGWAHQFEEFILLARELRRRSTSVIFCFAGQGNRYKELKNMVTRDDSNIKFAGFTDERNLPLRLACADIHMISLCQGWEGIVVPSKFFGSLASGRPLIYSGTPNSCIAEIIKKQKLGFVLERSNIDIIADNLEELIRNKDNLRDMQKTAFEYYKNNYTKKIQNEKWDKCLREYVK
jgi:glycosyltransferase involved in cell wall biosynthesis